MEVEAVEMVQGLSVETNILHHPVFHLALHIDIVYAGIRGHMPLHIAFLLAQLMIAWILIMIHDDLPQHHRIFHHV